MNKLISERDEARSRAKKVTNSSVRIRESSQASKAQIDTLKRRLKQAEEKLKLQTTQGGKKTHIGAPTGSLRPTAMSTTRLKQFQRQIKMLKLERDEVSERQFCLKFTRNHLRCLRF